MSKNRVRVCMARCGVALILLVPAARAVAAGQHLRVVDEEGSPILDEPYHADERCDIEVRIYPKDITPGVRVERYHYDRDFDENIVDDKAPFDEKGIAVLKDVPAADTKIRIVPRGPEIRNSANLGCRPWS